MDLKVFHDTVRFFLNDEQNGKHSPPEIDNTIHIAQMWEYNDKFDEYSKTQELHDSLSVFSTRFQFVNAPAGLIQLPVEPQLKPYEHLLSVWVQYYDNSAQEVRYKPIKILNEDELADRLDSQILKPTVVDPFGFEPDPGKIQLYPAVSTLSGFGYYLRTPARPFYKFTQTERKVTYQSTGSTQLEWKESSMNKLIVKTLQLLGLNVDDTMIMQYTQAKNQEDI